MKTILILEDDDSRFMKLRALFFKNWNILYAPDFATFFEKLTSYPGVIDLVTLDHDLGLSHTENLDSLHNPGNGIMAVNLLAIIPDYLKPLKINVHSANPVGSKEMVDRLINAGYDTTKIQYQDLYDYTVDIE